MPFQRLNLDLDLLRSFIAVADAENFTRAAERIGRQQSTVSLQIKRLEDLVGGRLLIRSPHSVALTPRGQNFLAEARRLIDLNDVIVARARAPDLLGVVRLGTPEDFATRHLPQVLERFAQVYPGIALEVTCDLTLNLLQRFRLGAFDLALIKREQTVEADGTRVWHEPLVWVGGSAGLERLPDPLPLVVSPEPCVYRHRACVSLDEAEIPWRIAYVCGSLAGSLAAVRAKLGFAVLPRDMVPDDLGIIGDGLLPAMMDTEIGLLQAEPLSVPAQKLREHIIRSLGA